MMTINPKKGTGATRCLFTDRHACTITRVSESGKTIWFKRDKAIVVNGTIAYGDAEYKYEYDEDATELKATLRKNGQYRESGTNLVILIGVRDEYYDPCF